jgi:hypothetical protein
MKPELKAKIIAYNKSVKEKGEKATDLDIIVAEVMKLPYGQLKKVLTDEVVEVLKKYGHTEQGGAG